MKEKYQKITFIILACIPLSISLFLLDQLVLPQKQISDKLISYRKIAIHTKGNVEFVGNRFLTEKGYEFSVKKTFIDENNVVIERSYIFQSVTSVKSNFKDYSNNLLSALNGACLYFTLGLLAIAIISLALLKFDKKLSENGFQNIILINSFLLIITLYVFAIYN